MDSKRITVATIESDPPVNTTNKDATNRVRCQKDTKAMTLGEKKALFHFINDEMFASINNSSRAQEFLERLRNPSHISLSATEIQKLRSFYNAAVKNGGFGDTSSLVKEADELHKQWMEQANLADGELRVLLKPKLDKLLATDQVLRVWAAGAADKAEVSAQLEVKDKELATSRAKADGSLEQLHQKDQQMEAVKQDCNSSLAQMEKRLWDSEDGTLLANVRSAWKQKVETEATFTNIFGLTLDPDPEKVNVTLHEICAMAGEDRDIAAAEFDKSMTGAFS